MVRLADMSNIVFTLVLIGMFVGIGLLVLTEVGSSSSVTGTTAETAINETIDAIAGFPGWLPIIVVIIAASIIIGVLVNGFAGNRSL